MSSFEDVIRERIQDIDLDSFPDDWSRLPQVRFSPQG